MLIFCLQQGNVREQLIRVAMYNDDVYVTLLHGYLLYGIFCLREQLIGVYMFNDNVYFTLLHSFLIYGIFCLRHAEFSSRTADPCLYILRRHLRYFSPRFFTLWRFLSTAC